MNELADFPLSPILEDEASLRARDVRHLDALVSCVDYHSSSLVRTALWRAKYRKVANVAESLASVMIKARALLPANAPLCPVPLHWSRRFARGFNQSEVLARGLAAAGSFAMCACLHRARQTGYQSHRKRQDRLAALQGKFVFLKPFSPPMSIILVDDVSTTGATLDACAEVLKRAGVQRVYGWVFARS